jgi:hypothetical protein
MGQNDPPPQFDYDAYLAFLQQHNHNFVRLWTWELMKWTEGGPEFSFGDPFKGPAQVWLSMAEPNLT